MTLLRFAPCTAFDVVRSAITIPRLGIGCLLIIFLAGCSSISVMRSEEIIRGSLLKLTPLGSSRQEVLQVVAKKGWGDVVDDPHHGLFIHEPGKILVGKKVGVSGIQATLGTYPYLPLGATIVCATWAFDERGQLIEIHVEKSTDSL